MWSGPGIVLGAKHIQKMNKTQSLPSKSPMREFWKALYQWRRMNGVERINGGVNNLKSLPSKKISQVPEWIVRMINTRKMSKSKIQEAFLHRDYSEPWGLALPKSGGRARQRDWLQGSAPRWERAEPLRTPDRRTVRTPMLKEPSELAPLCKKPHLLHEPPQNLEKLKLRVPFLVTEIKAKYPEQTMKQPEGQSGMLVRDWNPKIKQMNSGGSEKQKSHGLQKSLQTYKQAPISRNTHKSIGILFDWPVGLNTGDREVSVLTSQRKLLGLVS